MSNKCQAPGMECENCRLNCQLPLIEAEKAQRERQMKNEPQITHYADEHTLKNIARLEAELNRLQVALEATIAEKEQYKSLYEGVVVSLSNIYKHYKPLAGVAVFAAKICDFCLFMLCPPIDIEALKEKLGINEQAKGVSK